MTALNSFKLNDSFTIIEAIACMNDLGSGFCVYVDESDKVIGVFTDGDFRRVILKGISLNNNLRTIVSEDFIFLKKGYSNDQVESLFLESVAKVIPVLDKNSKLIELIFKEVFFGIDAQNPQKINFSYPVVVMAGGEGLRLAPFTNILPKPLLPIGDDAIINVIMNKFYMHGLSKFFVTVNSKKQMIKGYFHDHKLPYDIRFIDEDIPMGTAGSLGLIKNEISTNFFVVNCDIILDVDYGEIIHFHEEGGYDLTIVAALKEFVIPYGVCELDESGLLISINEKPKQHLLVNTGLYFLDQNVLNLIPGDKFMHMTEVVEIMQKKGLNVGVFPITEKSWLDVGQWEEYSATLKQLGL
jgi:dTDP-glucose pyrophosphorylase